ncbi:MAG TPA: SDR family NAD(P)-dependent oxidoreductase [Flavobacteriales bacterium]|nr:SDR family NAD(P)-dependent oxidoreductase [Flavobacteriales bacterium]
MPIILITGATAGFGEATARRFAHEGWRVIITGRRMERLEALRKELEGLHGTVEGPPIVHVLHFDVRDSAAASDNHGILALSRPVEKWYLAYPRWLGKEWFDR